MLFEESCIGLHDNVHIPTDCLTDYKHTVKKKVNVTIYFSNAFFFIWILHKIKLKKILIKFPIPSKNALNNDIVYEHRFWQMHWIVRKKTFLHTERTVKNYIFMALISIRFHKKSRLRKD